MNLRLYYPFKPFSITQHWGNVNPAYAQQFGDPKFRLHNGIDAKPRWDDTSYPVYCPVEGFVVESVSYDHDGGGHQISLISKEKLRMFEQLCYARIWLCHAEKVLVAEGYEPKLGELLMIADNTGFSTGPHTHMGLYRLNDNKQKIDTNEATGSFDPGLFWTRMFAIDQASLTTLIKSNLRYYQYRLGL